MSHKLIILFITVFSLLIQGCQTLPWIQKKTEEQTDLSLSKEQEQIFRLLRQGNRYDELGSAERKVVCNRLKLDFEQHQDWQTAWLLVYSLNKDFDCINPRRTLQMLNTIQQAKDTGKALHWLNNNQIPIHNRLKQLQSKVNKYQRKNKDLKNQLNEAEIQLQEVISKIQALKAIETSINKKLDDEPADTIQFPGTEDITGR